MATAVKTIEYAFPLSTTNVNSATARDFTSITVYIPESSISFKSVTLEMGSSTWNGTQSVTAVLMGISLGAVARSDNTVTQTITNSAENYSFIFTRDVTSYFSTNWTGTNMAAGARLTVTGPATTNAFAKLIITYSFDDSASNTRVKTVRIPMDGNTGALTTSLANVGGVANQIPNLSTFLPENSVVIRDLFVETFCHTGAAAGTTDIALNLRFDGVNTLAATYEGGGTTDYSLKRIDKSLTLFGTGATSNFEASTGNVATPYTCLCGVIHTTYEYNHSASTTILNSVMLCSVDGHGWAVSGLTTESEKFIVDYINNEPGTLTLKQSGVLVSTVDSDAIGLTLRIQDQDIRTFIHPATVRSGNVYQLRRFDSGAAGSSPSNVALSNPTYFPIWINTTGTTLGSYGSNLTGIVYLNYTSDKSTSGDTAHNKTTIWCAAPYSVETLAREKFPPASYPTGLGGGTNNKYYLNNAGFQIYLITTSTPTSNIPINFKFYQDASDDTTWPGGYVPFFDTFYSSDDEVGTSIFWANSTDVFNNGYQSGNLDLQVSRNYLVSNNPNVCFFNGYQIVTTNNITTSYSGTVYGVASNTVVSLSLFSTGGTLFGTTTITGSTTFQIEYPTSETAFVRASITVNSVTYYEISTTTTPPSAFNIDYTKGEYGYSSG